jgi:glycine/D-amino acid oxidase-like deaminating enzyme
VSTHPLSEVDPRILRSLADAAHESFWLDSPHAPEPTPALVGRTQADLVVVGAGFSGLWSAILAKEEDPTLDVVVLEARAAGWAASGRNGGFVASSLTHGLPNGAERFADEMSTLVRLGQENLAAMAATLQRYDIDADWESNGELTMATQPWQLAGLTDMAEIGERYGEPVELWDQERVQAEVHSPTYLGAAYEAEGAALVNPAKLAWGLRRAALDLGVRLYERTPATALSDEKFAVTVTTPYGSVRAPRVALATNVFPSLLKRTRLYVVPVWDYAIMTEPLTPEQRASIGWAQRQGLADAGNQFHYYRLSADDRILFGGYDAVYYYGSGMGEHLVERPESFALLAQHFFDTFPQLDGLRFSHAWGGAIDTCTRFCSFWGQAMGGKVAYVMGYTGLGVGASRFGAQVMLDLLSGQETERTALQLVQSKPIPFPPEPVRAAAINLTRWSIDRADRSQGERNVWLRTLDRFGLGFDS